MLNQEAKNHFEQRVKGRNFITPNVVEFGWIKEGEVSYELSKGPGLVEGEGEIFGVTFAHKNQENPGVGLNKCFTGSTAKNDAICYIVRLKGFVKND